jgi:hypothetical protein
MRTFPSSASTGCYIFLYLTKIKIILIYKNYKKLRKRTIINCFIHQNYTMHSICSFRSENYEYVEQYVDVLSKVYM